MKQEIIERIIDSEWQMFGKVENQGGRAGCQDDGETFRIMRGSQLSSWDQDTLQSYLCDLHTAEQQGRNLITEKYARMMESTDPAGYLSIAPYLSVLSDEKKELIRSIADRQVACLDRFARQYPHITARMRPIHSARDTREVTSFETYTMGEMSTYSLDTLRLLDVRLTAMGDSYGEAILTQTAAGYGYDSLDELERLLAKHDIYGPKSNSNEQHSP